MERGLAMVAFGAAAAALGRESSPSESRSTSSSGCQSGWTLYLDHSNDGAARRCVVPCEDPAGRQRWMVLQQAAADGDEDEVEDSMASDASSGPRLCRPHDGYDEAHRGHSGGLRCRCHGFVVVDQRGRSCSGASGQRISRGSASGSGCHGGSSTWSRSSQGGVARKAAVVTATSQYREIIVIDDDVDDVEEELDDTASSSSAVFSCPMPMVHAR